MNGSAFTGGLILSPDSSQFTPLTLHARNGIITAIDTAAAAADEEEIDMAGQYLIPGLIDAHYHLASRSGVALDEREVAASMIEAVINSENCIASGVTSVRDCGCRHEGIYALQSAIRSSAVIGPDSVTAGRNPTGAKAPEHWRNITAATPEGIRDAVRSQVAAGAGWIKIILAHAFDPLNWADVTPFMTEADITAAIDEAHLLGVRIGAHCEGWDIAEQGIRLGLDSLDHAPLLTDIAIAGMLARNMTYTPTLWAFSTDAGVDLSTLTAQGASTLEHWRETHRSSVRRAAAAGVTIAAGSDSASVVTGRGVLINEMIALHECGLSTTQVLAAATRNAAAVMDRDDTVGTLTPGLRADIVALPRDPLIDLDTLREPESVWKTGILRYTPATGIIHNQIRSLEDAVVARWE